MRKILLMLLALAMILPGVAAVADEAPYPISILMPTFYTEAFQYENNPTLQAIEAATNTKLDVTFVPDASYPEAVSLALAGDMPKILVVKGHQDPVIVSSARAGAFWDITDYIADTVYLKDGSQVVYDASKIDGRLYGIYRSRPLARNGIIYRSDWAEALGLGVPETLDDLAAMAKAFTDPEKGTYGLVMCKYIDGTISLTTIMHGAPNTWGVDADGNVYPAHEDPKFLEGLNWLRDLYAAGAINQDFMVLESTIWDDPIKNDQAGLKLDVMDGGYRLQDWFEQNKGVPAGENVFNLLPVVKNSDGEERMWPTAGLSGEIIITKTAKTEEDMLKCLEFLDFLNGPEGQTLVNWGVQDQTYWVDEEGWRIATPADLEISIRSLQGSINQLGMGVNGDLAVPMKQEGLRKLYNDNLVTYFDYVIGNPCAAFISETQAMVGAQLKQLVDDANVQYIAGQIDEAQLKAVYEQWRGEGGDAVTAEMDEMYKAANGK
ncbi:MAG: extracellular solute-binding protein [Oscillospiraceae bacterium]|jgi:putative aldouronate transport system substrate-binding protein|nr:extracellular solute-binding protein [Oscillospiraceae bacterium]